MEVIDRTASPRPVAASTNVFQREGLFRMSGYSHTQRAPLCYLLYASAFVCFFLGFTGDSWASWSIAGGTGFIMLVFASAFHFLTVRDRGDYLKIGFGPLPLFGRKVRYAEIAEVEITRSSFLDGWGIHYTFSRGWIWNLWGLDCVAIRFRNGARLRIGTDDAPQLAAFLTHKIPPSQPRHRES